ncbi:serine/threonine-protein kinase [Pseudarthrobacter sp. ATCC 49987]|uniref:serine/threonine-protein kinase n=1 Tax=Pseudarthrobacter sp. ATCC 49987 TaxID=2698204 RepID=UPI001F1EB637|nr:serine/threonine-protein kinase [Pseudarthrobacter sp. ATCC 49987]
MSAPHSAVALAERPAALPVPAAVGLDARVLALPDAPGGRFLVHELLGRGATATVFRGTDVADGRPVAIKVAEGPEPQQAERIHAEARVLASLDHPAIVTFIAEGVVPAGDPWAGRPFLVEEFAYGGSLAERIRSGPADAGEVARWAVAALSGLAHVHARGLVHRDIKPANILLSALRRSAVRIADFGIATPAGTTLEPGDSSGTVHYMSPEQAAGRHPGAPGDIYSLGLVLLECLTGAKAFPGTPVESLVARTLRKPLIPAGLGTAWVSLLTALTAMDPAARPSAAAAGNLAAKLPRAS